MCGRFVIKQDREELARLFQAGLIRLELFEPNYNVAPTNIIPAVIDEADERALVGFHWGFTPRWAKALGDGPRPINARRETVATSGMFRDAFRHRRTLIPADGFYEWKSGPGGKQPYYIHRSDGDVLALAGIWERWVDPQGQLETPLESCVIITTSANDAMSQLHERMPVIVERADWERWLDPDMDDPDALEDLLDPPADRLIAFHPVNPDVGNVRNNRPDLIEPFEQGKLL